MQIDEVPWLAAVIHLTEVGIDTLMVLTGFLAILSLIPALQQVRPMMASHAQMVMAFLASPDVKILCRCMLHNIIHHLDVTVVCAHAYGFL